MDDCLASCQDEETAVRLMKGLCKLLKSGGFELTKWMSNSRELLKCISPEDRANQLREI